MVDVKRNSLASCLAYVCVRVKEVEPNHTNTRKVIMVVAWLERGVALWAI